MKEDNFFYYLKFDRFRTDESGESILAGYFLERSKDTEDLALTVILDEKSRTAHFTDPSRKLLRIWCPPSFQRMVINSFSDPENPVFSRARKWLNQQKGDRPAK
jgi:hypothetical protein